MNRISFKIICILFFLIFPISILAAKFNVILYSAILLFLIPRIMRLNFGELFSKYKIFVNYLAVFSCISIASTFLGMEDLSKSASFFILLKLCLIFISAIMLGEALHNLDDSRKNKIIKHLLTGFLISVPFYVFELTTEGKISMAIKNQFGGNEVTFFGHIYNKGLTILSMYVWVICFYLHKRQYKKYAFLIWMTCFLLIIISDSLSAKIAILVSSILFLLLNYRFKIFSNLLAPIFFTCSIIFFLAIYYYDPIYLENKLSFLEDSSLHRIYVWDFVLNLISQKPILGYGLDASRYFMDEKVRVGFIDYELLLLPVHPHNNLLQLWLETGIFSLITYMLGIITVISRFKTSNNKYLICLVSSLLSVSSFAYGIWQSWYLVSIAFIFVIYKLKD